MSKYKVLSKCERGVIKKKKFYCVLCTANDTTAHSWGEHSLYCAAIKDATTAPHEPPSHGARWGGGGSV